MAMMPDVRIPSVKMGPKKFCRFGVRRKGTTSFVANIGSCCDIPEKHQAVAKVEIIGNKYLDTTQSWSFGQ